MKPWTKCTWFVDLVSAMQAAILDAQSEIEVGSCRPRIDVFLRDDAQPQTLSNRVLVKKLAKAMTSDHIYRQDLSAYDGLCSLLPSMDRIRKSLHSLHEKLQVPPKPWVIEDSRIPAEDFLKEINDRVFCVDE